MTRATLSRAVAEGEVVKLSRGLYQLPESEIDSCADLVELSKRAPRAVVCLVSALAFHDLTDQLPRRVWIAISAKDWAPKIDYPKTRIVRFREPYYSGGVQTHPIGGVGVKVYSIEKSIADAFRNPKLVDRSVTVEAMRSALTSRKTTIAAIAAAAEDYGAWPRIKPYLEAMSFNG